MNIEVRNIKYSASLSEETMAYTADIYIDGKKAGDARNQGCGGDTVIYPNALCGQLEGYAKALPPIVTTLKTGDGKDAPFSYQPGAGSIIDNLVSDELAKRDFRKMVKHAVVFTKADGKLYEIKARKGENVNALAASFAARQNTGAVYILNVMAEDEAFKIFMGTV